MNRVIRRGFPRLPIDGNLDLTYRCNNACVHCWLRLPKDAAEAREELSLAEIQGIVDEARSMGCQAWAISGGEPLLRPDFAEILDYIARKSVHYSLNTNGTLITPEIARIMTRQGRKMVALYGATADVHDLITGIPGSFEATMRGFAYLKEAGAGFEVQIIPMRANYHQYDAMLSLARSLSPQYRVGSSWLFFSACRSDIRNREIAAQRLEPGAVIDLDEPDPLAGLLDSSAGSTREHSVTPCAPAGGDDRLFAACVAARRDFHVDPYGKMSFCGFIKDPVLRFDLRRGSFREAWEEFIPSVAGAVRGGPEYHENCGTCDLRRDCRWCPVYGYLEHGKYSAKVDYLCAVAREARHFKENWRRTHVRYYEIAGITIQVATDFPIGESTFAAKFGEFRVGGPGRDTVSFRLFSSMPERSDLRLGRVVYRRTPWVIYRQSRSWVYLGCTRDGDECDPHCLAILDEGHERGSIYHRSDFYEQGPLDALTSLPTDQILLARLLANRQGCYLHASGIIVEGEGLLFVGHSGAGKSTMMKMLRGRGEILCDDRVIVRYWPEGFRIHGTWSHGELPDVSPADAPLRAILFLEKANTNELIPISDKLERLGKALAHVVKPLATADWWDKTLALGEMLAAEVPAYRLRFDMSGAVVDLLRDL